MFDKGKIAAALKTLGRKPWNGTRPAVFLTTDVHSYSGQFILIAGPAIGYDQPMLMRAAIGDSVRRYALTVQLPDHPGAKPPPGMFAVTGSLVWSDAAHGWIAHWQAQRAGRKYDWEESGVSFDDAFDGALAGALGVASGNQPPRQ